MSVTYGFYNSLNGDRVYTAEQFSSFLDGIVYDGVYQSVGSCFMVEPTTTALQIAVGTGRAWLDHTWTLNDAKLYLKLTKGDTQKARIDTVVIEVNKDTRTNAIKIVKGTPATNPVHPTLQKTVNVKQYPLADILMPVGYNSTILKDNITIRVGTSGDGDTPLCSGLGLTGIPSGGKTGYVLAKTSDIGGSVGWFHPDHLPYSDWMYVSGITEDDVVAAFKFKGANSMTEALTSCNVSKNKYTLTKSSSTNISWSAANGFRISGNDNLGKGYLTCETLMDTEFQTVAVKYANAEIGDNVIHLVAKAYKDSTSKYSGHRSVSLYAKMGVVQRYQVGTGYQVEKQYYRYPGVHYTANNGNDYGYLYSAGVSSDTTQGVLSCYTTEGNDSKKIFYNGRALGTTQITVEHEAIGSPIISGTSCVLIGDFPSSASSFNHGAVDIHAVIFFKRKLSAAEIARVHEAMALL